jgi:hypothetical protein
MISITLRPSTTEPTTPPSAGYASWLVILSGAVWGLWYFGMNWVGWGEPGSAAYARYEFYNRLAPLVLFLLLAATQFVHRRLRASYGRAGRLGSQFASAGLSVMAAGSALEFWAFTESSYAFGSLRGYGWSTYCLGLLLFYGGTCALGIALRRVPGFGAVGLLLMGWLPAGAALGAINTLTGAGLPAFSLAVALCGASYVLIGRKLAIGCQLSGVR